MNRFLVGLRGFAFELLVLAALVVAMWVFFCPSAGAAKERSDKERITQLEMTLDSVQKDLQGEHDWADEVNQAVQVLNARTIELNERLRRVETRGPVASLPRLQ